MTVGPHVYGDGRIGCWFTPVYINGVFSPQSFIDKLKHRVPRVKALGMTDAFLPREAALVDKQVVTFNQVFSALYEPPPKGLTAPQYAAQALGDITRLGVGACELNIEGVPDTQLRKYITDTVNEIRKIRKALRLRINVVPYKGQFLPVELFQSDVNLFVIVQNYLGNMDSRVDEDGIVRNIVDWGVPSAKVSVMYGAHISPGNGKPRVPSLPQIRYRGSIYHDDGLADGGYIS